MYTHKEYSCTDVFALAMIIYELFSGERPYAGAFNEEIPGLVKAGKRPDIKKLPIQYQKLVQDCWGHGVSGAESCCGLTRADHKKRIKMEEVVVQLNMIQPVKLRGACCRTIVFAVCYDAERTEPMVTFKDLERPISDVLHEHNMITPELQRGLAVAKVTTVAGLCKMEVSRVSGLVLCSLCSAGPLCDARSDPSSHCRAARVWPGAAGCAGVQRGRGC